MRIGMRRSYSGTSLRISWRQSAQYSKCSVNASICSELWVQLPLLTECWVSSQVHLSITIPLYEYFDGTRSDCQYMVDIYRILCDNTVTKLEMDNELSKWLITNKINNIKVIKWPNQKNDIIIRRRACAGCTTKSWNPLWDFVKNAMSQSWPTKFVITAVLTTRNKF